MTNKYKEDSITTLDPLSHVRLRPQMYIGNNNYSTQLIIEIFSNALDEFNIGNGNIIKVGYSSKDNVCSVSDEGQGFLVNEKREDGKTILQASFDEVNTSGKFSEEGVYSGSSLGLNGLGSKLTNFLSNWLEVTTYRDNKYEMIRFEEGVFKHRETGKTNHHSGTEVVFKPNSTFFVHQEPDMKELKKLFNDICGLCPTLTIELDIDGDIEKISHSEGIDFLIRDSIGKSNLILKNRLLNLSKQGKYKLDWGLSYCSDSESTIIPYVNFGLTEQGPHITAAKTTITRVINKWAREQGLLKDKDKNLDGNSIQEGMILVFNLVSPNVSYDAQTKSRVTSNDFVPFINDTISTQLELWLDNNPEDGKTIVEKALLARKAANAAKKAREKVKNGTVRGKKVKIMNPDKLKDAEYLGEDSTLLVVEGLSAGAAMATARDRDKYGILMLRGKLINALSNSDDKLLKNEEIQLLFKALGFSPNHYDSSNLRYGRLAICVDSDSDGFHIALLIMSALQHFCPQFIQEGRLCWLRSPLYILKNGKNETYYFTDEELNANKNNLIGELQRNKGLGSLSREQAKNSMFGKNQKIDVLMPDNASIPLLEQLMGKAINPRKDYIFENVDFREVKE